MNQLSSHHVPADQIIECHAGRPFPPEVLTIAPGSARSLSTYEIDVAGLDWTGKRPEGAFITRLHTGEWWVVFIEMKNIDTVDTRSSAAEKFVRAVDHFCKSGSASHGADHHRQWAAGSDPIPNLPASNHQVGAVMLVTRSGARIPTPFQVTFPSPPPKNVRTRIIMGSYTPIGPVARCGKPGIGVKIDVSNLLP